LSSLHKTEKFVGRLEIKERTIEDGKDSLALIANFSFIKKMNLTN